MNPSAAASRAGVTTNPVFGTFVFVFVEAMFFSALFSSFFVIKRGRVSWDMPASVQLPRTPALVNTFVLLLSGLFLFFALRALKNNADMAKVKKYIMQSFMCGFLFAAFQIVLLNQVWEMGLTMRSSLFGACYLLMVGAHLLHIFAGLILLTIFFFKNNLNLASVKALQIFWTFLVLVWPLLYAQLYR